MPDILEQHNRLRSALEKLVGESNPDELRKMKTEILRLPASEDTVAIVEAINTLLEVPYA